MKKQANEIIIYIANTLAEMEFHMTKVKKLTLAGMFAAMIALLTYFPHIPTATGGYIHLGDSLIYTAAILYGGIFGGITAGIGSALADLMVAPIYAIPTLIIKGIMGYTVGKMSNNRDYISGRNIAAMLVGGLIMMVGYGAYDVFMAATGESWSAILLYSMAMNFIQYVFGILLGILILLALKKTNIVKR